MRRKRPRRNEAVDLTPAWDRLCLGKASADCYKAAVEFNYRELLEECEQLAAGPR